MGTPKHTSAAISEGTLQRAGKRPSFPSTTMFKGGRIETRPWAIAWRSQGWTNTNNLLDCELPPSPGIARRFRRRDLALSPPTTHPRNGRTSPQWNEHLGHIKRDGSQGELCLQAVGRQAAPAASLRPNTLWACGAPPKVPIQRRRQRPMSDTREDLLDKR